MREEFTKSYLLTVPVALLSLLGLVLLVLYTSPTGAAVVVSFYFLVFLAVFSGVTAIQIFARKRFAPGPFGKLTKTAIRQSFFLAVLVVSLLYLQAQDLLVWWVGLSLVLFFMCLDIVCSI